MHFLQVLLGGIWYAMISAEKLHKRHIWKTRGHNLESRIIENEATKKFDSERSIPGKSLLFLPEHPLLLYPN